MARLWIALAFVLGACTIGERGTAPVSAPQSPIAEEGFVRIGGIDQWVSIRGADVRNPLIVVVHGGPAVANSSLPGPYGAWERNFTVVQWDQRGAGKTFGRNGKSTPEVTADRITEDGIEVVEYSRHRVDKRKVILLGHSWGSLLGVAMIKKRPDLFSAYVGTGQVVSFAGTTAAQYDDLVKRASAEANQDALRKLHDIGPPPYEMGPKFFELQKWNDHYLPRVDADYLHGMLERVRAAPKSTPQEAQSWIDGRQFSMRSLGGAVLAADLPAAQGYEMPVAFFIIQGAEDRITPTVLVEDYFRHVRAPRKEMAVIPGAGHFAYATHSEAFLADLEKFVGAAPT